MALIPIDGNVATPEGVIRAILDLQANTGTDSAALDAHIADHANPHVVTADQTGAPVLAGKSGGQTLYGGTGASENLTLYSTSNATKGKVTAPNGFVTPKIYPASDSTTAFQINKADGTTNVLNVDTTNGRVGIGTTSPGANLYRY